MSYIEVKKSSFYEIAKRVLDIVFSLILLTVFQPVIVVVILLIKLDSKGPIFADTPQPLRKN